MAKRKPNQHNRLHLAVLAGIASINAHAIGIGEIEVQSRLNEPLRADVPLIQMQPKDMGRAQVRFHAIDSDASGSTNSSIISKFSGRFVESKNGYTLEIRSNENIREPIVSFYVEVILPDAHARREFTVLLDPPNIAATVNAAPANKHSDRFDFEAMESSINSLSAAPGSKRKRKAHESKPVIETTVVEAVDAHDNANAENSNPVAAPSTHKRASAADKPAAKKHPAEVAKSPSQPATSSGDVYGPVQKNETLWAIARKVRPSRDVPMLDTMQKLLAENPHAFVNNDMNRLRVGVTLHIPAFEQRTVVEAANLPTPTATPAEQPTTVVATTPVASVTGSDATRAAVSDSAAATPNHARSKQNSTSASTDATPSATTEQAAAMQARIDALSQRLEAVNNTLTERENRIAALENTLDQLSNRLNQAESRNKVAAISTMAPAPVNATDARSAPSINSTAPTASKTPAAPDVAVASYDGVSLPDGTWVWGMSAALAAGLGAAFMARRRNARRATAAAPSAVIAATAPVPTIASVAASERTPARTQEVAHHEQELTLDNHIRTQIIAPPSPAPSKSVDKVDVDLHQPAHGETVRSAAVVSVDGDGSAFATSPDGNIEWNDETVPNWSLERTIERTLDQTGETLAQSQTEPFLRDGAEATVAAIDGKSDNKVVPLKLDSARVEPVLKEVDLQMAYLQFEDAERLLMTPLQESPNEPSLLVKLAEVHVAAGNIDKFVDLAVRLSKIPEVRSGDDWKKIARMGEMVAPSHPLFEFVDTVEITRDDFGNIATRA